VRAVGALAALAALLVGVPVLLVRLGTWPITGVPTGDQVRDLPSTIVTDDAVLGVVTVILWAVWALFVLSVLVEVVVQLRRRGGGPGGAGAGRASASAGPPGRSVGGPVQGIARYLVGSLLMSATPIVGVAHVLPAGAQAPLVADAPAPADYTGFWATDGGGDDGVGAIVDLGDPSWEVPDAVEGLRAAPATVTVGRGDTAWSLAESHLGDGARWREIWEANHTRPQPDGTTWADADEPVRPGWTLRMPGGLALGAPAGVPDTVHGIGPEPAGALPVQALAAEAAAVPGEVTVQPGDNFWELAEGQLEQAWGRAPTDAEVVGHWQALVDANRAGLAPPGDPDLIHPGQVFSVPAPPADPEGPQGLAGGLVLGEPSPAPDAPTPAPDCDPADEASTSGGGAGSTASPDAADPVPDGSAGGAAPVPSGSTSAGGDSGTSAGSPDAGDGTAGGPAEGASPGDVGEVAPDEGALPAEEGELVPGSGRPDDEAAPDDGAAPDERATPGPVGDAASAADEAGSAPAEGADDERSPVPIGLVGGGIAVAGALVLLERRRRAQLRHRPRGGVPAAPAPPLRLVEEQLRWGADMQGARLLDIALRAAAAGAGATGLPAVRWVEASADEAVLVLASSSPAPPGFVALAADRWASTAGPDDLAMIAAHTAPPLPTLIPVGTTDHGAELLIELESSGVVTVRAAHDDARALLRAVVVAASTGAWSDQPRLAVVGLEPELASLPGVSSTATLADALAAAEAHADRTEDALRAVRCPTLGQARAIGANPEDWDPLVIVSAVPPQGRDEVRRLEGLAARSNSAVGVVVIGGLDVRIPGRELVIGDHGWLQVDGVDELVQPRRLEGDELGGLVALLGAATGRAEMASPRSVAEMRPRRPPPPPPPPVPAVDDLVPAVHDPAPGADDGRPDDARPTDAPGPGGSVGFAEPELVLAPQPPPAPPAPVAVRLADLLQDVRVLVRVLGEVEAVRLGPEGSPGTKLVPTRQRALEAIAYLALRESAVDREDLEISLFPDGANAAKTVYNTVSSARALLGDEFFPPPAGGRYELSSAVVTDYGIFSELVAEADETEDALAAADLLHEALSLVRGEPFTGVGRSYAWVGPHRGMIVAQVVDAAEELAEVRLAGDDWRGAEWAARQGLRAFPSDERMYRLLMRTARAAGNIPGVQRVFRELCDVLADPELGVEPDDTVHPETIELLEQLTGARPREGRLGA